MTPKGADEQVQRERDVCIPSVGVCSGCLWWQRVLRRWTLSKGFKGCCSLRSFQTRTGEAEVWAKKPYFVRLLGLNSLLFPKSKKLKLTQQKLVFVETAWSHLSSSLMSHPGSQLSRGRGKPPHWGPKERPSLDVWAQPKSPPHISVPLIRLHSSN